MAEVSLATMSTAPAAGAIAAPGAGVAVPDGGHPFANLLSALAEPPPAPPAGIPQPTTMRLAAKSMPGLSIILPQVAATLPGIDPPATTGDAAEPCSAIDGAEKDTSVSATASTLPPDLSAFLATFAVAAQAPTIARTPTPVMARGMTTAQAPGQDAPPTCATSVADPAMPQDAPIPRQRIRPAPAASRDAVLLPIAPEGLLRAPAVQNYAVAEGSTMPAPSPVGIAVAARRTAGPPPPTETGTNRDALPPLDPSRPGSAPAQIAATAADTPPTPDVIEAFGAAPHPAAVRQTDTPLALAPGSTKTAPSLDVARAPANASTPTSTPALAASVAQASAASLTVDAPAVLPLVDAPPAPTSGDRTALPASPTISGRAETRSTRAPALTAAPTTTEPREPGGRPRKAAEVSREADIHVDATAPRMVTPAPVATVASPAADDPVARQLSVAQDGQWLDSLARDIASAGNANGRLDFRLDPDHLGALTVQIAQGPDGASIRLTASTEAARTILADAQPRLVAEARAQGLTLREATVDTRSAAPAAAAPAPASPNAGSTGSGTSGRSDQGGVAAQLQQQSQQQQQGSRQRVPEPQRQANPAPRDPAATRSAADLFA